MKALCGSTVLQLKLEAYLGSGFMGDVAVDDVVVASGGCAVHPKEAERNTINVAPVSGMYTAPTPTTPALGPYDCYFEVDLCSWSSSVGEVRTRPHKYMYFCTCQNEQITL